MPTDAPPVAPPARARPSVYILWVALAALLAVSFAVDGPVLEAVRPLHHSRLADVISHTIRLLGTGYVQVPAALLMIAIGLLRNSRLKQAGGRALLAFVLSGAAVNVLKIMVHRPRPWVSGPAPSTWVAYLRDSDFQSFPSAETATTFAVALTIGLSYPVLRPALVAIAILVGLARVVVGSHHPSDVVAGAMLGLAVAQLFAARRREARTSTSGPAR